MSTPTTLRIALAQLPVQVGALAANAATASAAMAAAERAGADLCLTPEMHLSGYPLEDLLTMPDLLTATAATVNQLATTSGSCLTLLGAPMHTADLPAAGEAAATPGRLDALARPIRNVAVAVHGGAVLAAVAKRRLPTYAIFDDARHVAPGPQQTTLITVAGVQVTVLICEDLWDDALVDAAAADGAQAIVVLNASPFHVGKAALREQLVCDAAARTGCAVAYVNTVGAQDEIVFDGASLVAGPDGALLARAAAFTPDLLILDVPVGEPRPLHVTPAAAVPAQPGARPPLPAPGCAPGLTGEEAVYSAAVLGLREYFAKTRFTRAVLGLSGGIDSALVATIACDALGPDNVWGVGLPGPYSSRGSVDDAQALADNLGMRFDVVPIGGAVGERLDTLDALLQAPDGQRPAGFAVAQENLQARMRAVTLMALANTHDLLLLTTGNKSESAVGYMTVGGDALGTAPNPVGDAWKSTVTYSDGTVMPGVYALARWRNAHATSLGQTPPIPASTLTKPPSAELAEGQLDSDSLPPYEVLDPVLAAFLEEHATPDECVQLLVEGGMDAGAADALVRRVLRLIETSEWKRRQAGPRIKLTRLAFGRDRRMPIASAWRATPSHDRAPERSRTTPTTEDDAVALAPA
ncbi:NAD+ synthase [Rhodococcus sp. X156]|uniref:NAD+ synthase n=1 Tax=Rhodococcus sp. X156 TaxID=2499145 RepID=UPI000FDA4160|nr:NAD+ synthase [Rhodococcus sp. X156]